MQIAVMKKPIVVLAMIAGCTWTSRAAPAPLTTLQAVAALSNAQAIQHQPAAFEATVTYYRAFDEDLFVEDGDSAIYIHAETPLKLVPGDRVRVRGTMHESFRPFVASRDITLLGHGALPKPIQATYQQMIRGAVDCRLVTVHARILSADITTNSSVANAAFRVPFIYLQMLVDGSPVDANVDSDDADALRSLLDAEVEITGVVSGHFDNKMQQTGVLFHVQTLASVKFIRRAAVDPWSLPVTPMDRLIAGYQVRNLSERTRVHGTITYYQPEVALVLQDGSKSAWIATETHDPLRIGDVADAIGFPDVQNGFLTLAQSEIRDSSVQAPIVPPLLTWHQLASGGNTAHSQAFDLVSIEGQVVTEVRQATQDEYVLQTGGHLFSAIIRHPVRDAGIPLPAMKQVPVGARIRVTGICMLEDANPFNGEVPFNILMRSLNDIVVVANPPWLNVRNLVFLVGLLLLLVFVAGIKSWALERKVRLETAAAAYLEQRRGRILENINNARPLDEILAQITQLVSFRLRGAACWCRVTGGAPIGAKPASLNHLRIVQQEIPARAGTHHGTIFAALDARTKPKAAELEALSFAAGLATLAIETSRLYSDLVHRSEYDLLTDIENRFSLEKTLDSLILKARMIASAFGLIYIDLDDFKQVNDLYGHQVGDLYLQEVAQRMKRQLRPGDTLARLGGDEFAALVPAVHNRQAVEEIALRLERCFGQPFTLDGCILRGSASVGIALFPEDGETKDSLLRAADAAMYVAKNARRRGVHASEPHTESALAPKQPA
jgi:diguanylate cyclase (GGDEF)-like protein